MSEFLFKDIRPLVRFSGMQTVKSGFDLRDVHASDARIVYVFSEEVQFKMNGIAYRGTRGSLVLFRPSVRYCLSNLSGKDACVMSIDFSFDAPPDASTTPHPWFSHREWSEMNIEEQIISDVPELNAPLFLESMQVLEPLLCEMNVEQQNIRVFRREIRNTLLHAVLLHICRHLQFSGNKRSRGVVDEILDYIHRNYGGNLSNDAISRHFNYHPNYINRILKKRTGKSLHQYILAYRADRALSLLQTTSLSVSEIAERVGFSSLKHFSQTFKGIYGYSPLHFR